MNIRVIIDKLGPIRNSVVEFKPFMVFTGESGLGKSYTALLWYNLVTALTSTRLLSFLEQKLAGSQKMKLAFKFKDVRWWLNENTQANMGYLLGNDSMDCKVNYMFSLDDDMPIEIEVLQEGTANEMSRCRVNNNTTLYLGSYSDKSLLMANSLAAYLAKICFAKPSLSPLIFPPARAAFMGANMTSFIGMYRDFLKQLDDLKTPAREMNADVQFYANYIAKLADGRLVTENGSLNLQLESGTQIPICAAASSVKELTPFLLMLQNNKTKRYNSLLFEEPEAHVHPKKQFLVMDMLARCCNKGMMIQMTTHSDYLLGRLNQLLLLGRIRKASQEEFDNFCDQHHHNKNLYLDSEQVGGFYFKRNGRDVVIEQQNMEHGLPLSAFKEAVEGQMNLTTELELLAEKLDIEPFV